MTGGIVQLVAKGCEDIYLTCDPQITFFKVVYRRYTNFASEEMCQDFISKPDFNKKSSCVVPVNADMANRMALKITLPALPKNNNPNNKVAWVKYIGFAMVNTIEVEIDNEVIDRHYGEWLYLISQLTTRNITDGSIDKLVGNVPELTDFTNGKDEYILYIPLYFWFCRSPSLSIPLIALQYSNIKINVTFNKLSDLLLISPTHHIKVVDNIVNFKEGEYLCQKCDNSVIERYGIFNRFDPIEKKLYYTSLSSEKFIGMPTNCFNGFNDYMNPNNNQCHNTKKYASYKIKGVSSEYHTMPDFGVKSITSQNNIGNNIHIKKCKLLVNYVYLDNDERRSLVCNRIDYLIEQLYFTPNVVIDGSNRKIKIIGDQPCKLMVWLAQLDSVKDALDYFNYTDSIVRKCKNIDEPEYRHISNNTEKKQYKNYSQYNNLDPVLDAERFRIYEDIEVNQPIGKSLIKSAKILMNSQDRLKKRKNAYFEQLQPFQYSDNSLPKGANMYSFALFPFSIFPSGTTNFSQIEYVDVDLNFSHVVNNMNKANFRAYSLCYNVWRVNHGVSALVFV